MRVDVGKPMQVNFSVYFPKCIFPNTLHAFYSVVICTEQFKKLSSSSYYTGTFITLVNDYTIHYRTQIAMVSQPWSSLRKGREMIVHRLSRHWHRRHKEGPARWRLPIQGTRRKLVKGLTQKSHLQQSHYSTILLTSINIFWISEWTRHQ